MSSCLHKGDDQAELNDSAIIIMEDKLDSPLYKTPDTAAAVSVGNGAADSRQLDLGSPTEPAMSADSPQSSLEGAGENTRWHECCYHVKMAILLCVIVAVWGLLSLPIIFYHLPMPEVCHMANS